jgi:predicted nucleotidyltransferase
MYLNPFISRLEALCVKYRAAEFYAFGSVLTPKFNSESDLNFIVSFWPEVPIEDYASLYFDFLFELEKPTGRHVDLMTKKEINNPFLRESIEKTKTLLYAA